MRSANGYPFDLAPVCMALQNQNGSAASTSGDILYPIGAFYVTADALSVTPIKRHAPAMCLLGGGRLDADVATARSRSPAARNCGAAWWWRSRAAGRRVPGAGKHVGSGAASTASWIILDDGGSSSATALRNSSGDFGRRSIPWAETAVGCAAPRERSGFMALSTVEDGPKGASKYTHHELHRELLVSCVAASHCGLHKRRHSATICRGRDITESSGRWTRLRCIRDVSARSARRDRSSSAAAATSLHVMIPAIYRNLAWDDPEERARFVSPSSAGTKWLRQYQARRTSSPVLLTARVRNERQ
ncbi:hypothetical protein ON010_g2176 [Phytophthora cinnamomi]|nr:hypothetical protein ON010_g2176 [Phytophthora cinnamomi]